MLETLLAFALIVPDDKDDVKNAAKKLADAGSYSYTSTPKSEGGGGGGKRPQPGPIEGKVGKDGYTWLKSTIGESTYEAVVKGSKAALKDGDAWKSADDLGDGGSGTRPDPKIMIGRMLKSYKSPADEAQALVDKLSALKNDGDGAYSGDLTEEGAKSLLSRGGGGRSPEITGPKGSAKFWIKDGVLAKYEVNVQGKMTMGEREIDLNRTTTVEFKDVGSTQVEIPDDAKKLVE